MEKEFNVKVITKGTCKIFTAVYVQDQNYYFTFGSDPLFPYQNTYLIVKAKSKSEAIGKFRARHKDRQEGTNIFNAAFCYSSEEWEKSENPQYYRNGPAEIIE